MAGRLQFGLISTVVGGDIPIGDADEEIASGIGNNVDLDEENGDLAGDASVSGQGEGALGDIGEQFGDVGKQAVGHDGEGKVHGKGLASGDGASGDGGLTDGVSSVVEVGRTVGVLEAQFVGVRYGDLGGQGDVELHAYGGEDRERDLKVLEGYGVDRGDGMLHLEHRHPNYYQNDHDNDQYDGAYHTDVPASTMRSATAAAPITSTSIPHPTHPPWWCLRRILLLLRR